MLRVTAKTKVGSGNLKHIFFFPNQEFEKICYTLAFKSVIHPIFMYFRTSYFFNPVLFLFKSFKLHDLKDN